jgi:O-antigen/teichoic acid export membrane protein
MTTSTGHGSVAAGPASVRVQDPTRLRSSIAASLVGKAAEMVTLVLLATVVPRALGPTDYGHFAVPLTVVTLGSLAMTLGGPTLMARFVPAAAPAERAALARTLGARLARGRAAQLAAVAALALAGVAWDPDRFPPSTTAVVVVALALNVATSLALQVGLGLGRAGAWSARFPLQNATLVAAVLALYPAFGTAGANAALVLSTLPAAALAAVVVAPIARAELPRVAVPSGAVRFGALQAGAAALVQAAQRGGVVAVAVLAGSPRETGYAALATGIALGATYAVLQTFTVALPHLTHGADGEVTLRRLAGGLLAAIVPAALVGAAVLDAVVPAVFGERFAGANTAVAIALAVVVFAPLYALGVQAAALRLRPEAALASGVATALGFVVAALVLVPQWGAAGATGAAFAGACAGTAASVRLLPGAAGGRVAAASYVGAAAVLAVALLA